MPAPYIPPTDAALQDWLANFATQVALSPLTYGLTAGDSAIISAASNFFSAAYTLTVNPLTRTPVNIAAKDAQRASSVATVRVYAQMIKAKPGITDGQLALLGIHVDDPTPSPIPAPATSPLLSIVAATPLQHTLRYADQATPDSRAKPFGAIQIDVYVRVAAATTVDPELASFYGSFTKQPVAVNYDAADVGKCSSIFARWKTRTGLVGPWSLGADMTVAADGGV